MTNIKDLYYIHIPKTGGMAIEKIFYDYGGCVAQCFFRKYNQSIVKDKKYKDTSLWHIPFQFLDTKFINNVIKTKKIFAIVRNPYDRIISAYKFWLKYYNDRLLKKKLNNEEKKLIEQIKYYYNNSFIMNATNLNNFIKKILNDKNYYKILDSHFIPMYEYTIIKSSNKNKLKVFPNNILKIEELDKDFNNLIKQYKLKIPLNITKTTKVNITFGNVKQSDLNKESIELINKIYHYDFKFFNYQKL